MGDGMYDAAQGDLETIIPEDLWKQEKEIVEDLEKMVEKAKELENYNPVFNKDKAKKFISMYEEMISTIKKNNPYFWKESQ